jgi:hypothetical protein
MTSPTVADMSMWGKKGKLSAKTRQGLPKADFALPGKGEGPKGAGAGSYPIPDKKHARLALSYGKRFASPEELSTIRRKVDQKYPRLRDTYKKKD